MATLPPLGEGARAILASVDAAVSGSAARSKAVTRWEGAPPEIMLEDAGGPGISLSDEA